MRATLTFNGLNNKIVYAVKKLLFCVEKLVLMLEEKISKKVDNYVSFSFGKSLKCSHGSDTDVTMKS